MVRKPKSVNKQQVISEYLTGTGTFTELSGKYGVNARTIQSWVRSFRERHPERITAKAGEGVQDVNLVKKQLAQAELKNELLEEVLRLAEEHAGVDFRKKFGSGQW